MRNVLITRLIPGGGGERGGVVAVWLVPLPASPLTVQFLNRRMPVSWWSWEEEGEAFCWAAEVACAARGKTTPFRSHFTAI